MSRRFPNLNQIRAFEAAARHLSFKDAAEELHVTHAAVSHQIKALEADLGIQLFYRRPRRVELTVSGQSYARTMTRAINDIADATQALVAEQMTGEITISMAPFLSTRTILPHLAKFHLAHPALVVIPEMTGEVVDFQKSNVSAAVRYGFGKWPGLQSKLLYECNVFPVAAPSYLEGQDQNLNPADIAQMTLARNVELPDEWSQWFALVGHLPENQIRYVEYSNQGHVVDMALSGTGVALADPRWVAADLRAGRLRILSDKLLHSKKSLYLVFPSADHPDARVLAFADWYHKLFTSGADVDASTTD